MDDDWDNNGAQQQTHQAQSSNNHRRGSYERRNENNFRQSSGDRHNNGRYNNRDRSRGSNRDDRSGRREQDSTRNSNEEDGEKTTFFVETSKLGKLIGKGGSKIRELEGQTNAKIKVFVYLEKLYKKYRLLCINFLIMPELILLMFINLDK